MRPAVAADVDRLRAIAVAAFAHYVPRIGRKPAPMVADFATHVAAGQVHVIEEGGRIVGYIVTHKRDDGQFIDNVAVDPSRHRRGHGLRLMQFAEAEAARNACPRVFLFTNIHMRENLDIYARLGYAETHRIREDGFDRVYLEKRLTP